MKGKCKDNKPIYKLKQQIDYIEFVVVLFGWKVSQIKLVLALSDLLTYAA